METRVSSASKEVIIGGGLPTVLIGERINPTGKKKLSRAIESGDMGIVRKEALEQAAAGANILDVNVGVPGIDQKIMLPQVVQEVMGIVDIPLCIDTDNIEALEAALKVYKGKALVNSVSGEERSLASVLPLIKDYGAAVIGLVQDDEGAPADSDRRVAIAHRIIERAESINIPREDVIIDCLALTVGADSRACLVTMETIRKVKAELGVNLTLGASNISFGLPDRNLLNCAFLCIAIATGVTCPVVDVSKVRPFVLAADLALGHDDYAMRYIKAYRQRQKTDVQV